MSGKDEQLELIPEHKPQDLVIEVPKPDEKGFLRKQSQLVKFMHAFQSSERSGEYPPDMIENMVEFLLTFVSEPKDRDEARDLLWELSENEFLYVMASIRGVDTEMVPPSNDSP